jgi:hypothetical protein
LDAKQGRRSPNRGRDWTGCFVSSSSALSCVPRAAIRYHGRGISPTVNPWKGKHAPPLSHMQMTTPPPGKPNRRSPLPRSFNAADSELMRESHHHRLQPSALGATVLFDATLQRPVGLDVGPRPNRRDLASSVPGCRPFPTTARCSSNLQRAVTCITARQQRGLRCSIYWVGIIITR